MSKIFGHTNRGGKDWFSSDAYSDKEIESIKDPEGGSGETLSPAIPSPFARIDLAKTAFRNINKTPELKAYNSNGNVLAGRTDEKLVSDTLDLAEMLFNSDSLRENLRVIVWDKDAEIAKMKASSDAHRRLAETLELYLQQDKESYNFDLLRRLYILEFNHKIIGCTSPATLFFPTANDLTHAQIKLTKNDVLFDHNYIPLYEREVDFQKYFHHLFRANPLLASRMKVVSDYLDKNLAILDRKNHALYEEINKLNPADFLINYSELDSGKAGDIIEVLGVPLRKRKKEDILGSIAESDFRINASKTPTGQTPLVLQNNFNKRLRYVNDNWDHTVEVPYADEAALEKRSLPGARIQYPYLTVSDFLEPYLIRLVYPINKEKFFDGNVNAEVGDDSKGFLLPLKKQFFDYFTPNDLLGGGPGKPGLEMTQGVAGSVRVTLRIPIMKEGEYIAFERTYYQSLEHQITKPDEADNKGVVVEQQVGLTLFPFVKTNLPDVASPYRVQVIDRNVAGVFKNSDYALQFFNQRANVPISIVNEETAGSGKPRKRTRKQAADATTQYYVLDKEFDYIYVQDTGQTDMGGIVIPKWPHFQNGNTVFTFALDFGTTNTHIEYKAGASAPKAFDITVEDMQIATLFDSAKTSEDFGGSGAIAIREFVDYEFLPEQLGGSNRFKFPTRTVSGEGKDLDLNKETNSLADFNIPFTYEKTHDGVNEIKSNLKWAKVEPGNTKRIRAYFETLLLLMRNKVLRNGGNLTETKLVWFYPSSMTNNRKDSLEGLIRDLYQKYFNATNPPIGISESLAPFYYYKNTGQLPGGTFSPVVSIDIGGGTTDVVVFKSSRPILLSSFKFAANAIFGDGFYEFGATSNGLIKKYAAHYENLLSANKQYDLMKVLDSIKDKNKSEDIIAFLFSLEKNYRIRDANMFSFNALLAEDNDYKIIFLYFYSAIIYHVAQLMKTKLPDTDLPKNIVFSGTGSKILSIITRNQRTLSEFSELIFAAVFEKEFGTEDLVIKAEKDIPKELTCKGGLMTDPEDLDINIKKIKAILTGLEDESITRLRYSDLTNEVQTEITDYVADFNRIFLDLDKKMSFSDNFGVSYSALEIFKNGLNRHLRDYLAEGLEYTKKMDEVRSDEKEIEETLFFYPIIGAINHLSKQLGEVTPVNS
ncbi:hypothetical protein [Persicitalea jodogahamensis]|uniref:Uncharacterized protein n=1 Tax=Persicitalea jodogahamensis TaxID=402147 RepID=A0A8J3D3C8_9BACT|nr:hypothetical protein [Persicitalea jodogahamensis]GHB67201.1 hypothetical protein GCM10007390_20620 [Persicitalea jodogahamensis]